MLKNPLWNDVFNRIHSDIDRLTIVSNDTLDILATRNFQSFVENLQIITKKGELRPLIMNVAQEQIWHWFLGKRESKQKARGICCKSRREGISTLIEAICFSDVVWRPNRYSYVASHERESADFVFRMSKIFYKSLPQDWRKRRTLHSDTKNMMMFEHPHNSAFTSATANKKGLASSQLIHNLHLSEPAKYPDPPAKDAITSVLQCVPDHWDTLVFWESTAFGKYNIFHTWYQAAKAGDNDYDPIFLSWKNFPEYFFYFVDSTPPIPSDAIIVPRVDLTLEENDFKNRWEISDEQMAWFVDKLRNSCHNDWGEANQEYPVDDSLAFKFTGRPWFDSEAMEQLQNRVQKPISRGAFEFIGDDTPECDFVEDEYGPVTVWEWPKDGAEYVAGMDVAEGVGADWTVIQVLIVSDEGETIKPRQVAKFRSNRINAHRAGIFAFQLCHFYNRAFLGVEVNNQGLTTLTLLERGRGYPQLEAGYPMLYYHTTTDRKTREETRKLGWRTTRGSKELMLGELAESIKAMELEIPSAETVVEMDGFAWDAEKQDWVATYENRTTHMTHDDEIISLAISVQMVSHSRNRAALGRIKEETW